MCGSRNKIFVQHLKEATRLDSVTSAQGAKEDQEICARYFVKETTIGRRGPSQNGTGRIHMTGELSKWTFWIKIEANRKVV